MFDVHKGRTIGRLLYFLYEYGVPFTENLEFLEFKSLDVREVRLNNKVFAYFSWDGDSDVPTFIFQGDFKEWYQEAQARKKDSVVQKSKDFWDQHKALTQKIGDWN